MTAKRGEQLVVGLLAAFGLIAVIASNSVFASTQLQPSWLARSFAAGRLDIPNGLAAEASFIDLVFRNGRAYWPLGPFTSVMLIPFVAVFGADVAQVIAQIVVAFGVFFLAWALARRHGFDRHDSLWLSSAFCFGTVTIGVIMMNSPWLLAGSLAALLLLAACLESRSGDRPAMIGLFLALAAATRFTAALAAVYFFTCELLSAAPWRVKAKRLSLMALPLLAVALLLAGYNQARFGDVLQTGHLDLFMRGDYLAPFLAAGGHVFHPANIARNAYYYFLKLPEWRSGLPVANPNGMSVLLLSPVFIFALFARRRSAEFIAAALTTVVMLAVFLSYSTSGFVQFGPRYLLDLLPLWYLLLLRSFAQRGFRWPHKALILTSVIANFALFAVYTLYYVQWRHLTPLFS